MISNPKKIMILSWSMNFLTLCITINLLQYGNMFVEVNPIQEFMIQNQIHFIFHAVLWTFVAIVYGLYYERWINKNNYNVKKYIYIPYYFLLGFFMINAINDLWYYLNFYL